MAHKLAIAFLITFPVTLKIDDEGRQRQFRFELTAKRLPQAQLDAEDKPVADVLRENVTGWRGQQLVLDEDSGQPSEFTPDAFDVMLGVLFAPSRIFEAYAAACGAKGRAKN